MHYTRKVSRLTAGRRVLFGVAIIKIMEGVRNSAKVTELFDRGF